MEYLVIETDESYTETSGDKYLRLKKMYDIIDCELVEFIYLKDDKILIIDEEGKLKNSEINKEATKLVKQSSFIGDYLDYIVGIAILIDQKHLK